MAAPAGAIPMLGGLSLRFTTPRDEDFLMLLFKAARPWFNWTTLERDAIWALYEQQMSVVRAGTGSVYPEHLEFIVEKTGQAVAHVVVDLGYHDWHISQLEVHPEARGKGIGSDIVRSLQAAAAKPFLPLTVSTPMVEARAVKFWGSLGFGLMAEAPPVLHLAWLPPGRPATTTWFS